MLTSDEASIFFYSFKFFINVYSLVAPHMNISMYPPRRSLALPLWRPALMWRIMNANTASRTMAMKAAYIILKILFPMMFSVLRM